ncbi:MAG: TIGR00180 family glycosyltransferase [Candidatus Kapaibacterium sp.]|nr:MAG: TIGR00180 family glycosyltransferase [Candidatus Kapabacteria bacterium]
MKQSQRNLITIITPTYNRPHYLTRHLDYYAETGLQVIVEDSSESPLEHPLTSASHVRYNWKPNRGFTEKFYTLIQQVETPYIALCSDDDFIIPEAIDECIAFLEQHPEYTVADGQRMRVVNKNGRNYFTPELRTDGYPGKHNTSDDSLARVKYQNAPHEGLVCAVIRTRYMKDVIQYCNGEFVKPDVYSVVLNITLPAAGKTIILPTLYSVLSYIPGSSGSQAQYTVEFNRAIMTETQKREYELLVEYCTAALIAETDIKSDDAHAMLHELLSAFAHQPLNEMLQYDDANILKRIAKTVLPKPFYLLLGESIKIQQLLGFLRSQEGNAYSNQAVRRRLERVSAFVEKYNQHTSLRVEESQTYLAVRRAFIDRYFAVVPRV